MNRPDERAPRARREVPTVRGMFALVIALPFAIAVAWQYRIDMLAWAMVMPPGAFWALAAFGAALALGSLILLIDYIAERVSRRRANGAYCADADLPPESRP